MYKDLVIPETLLIYRTLPNLNSAYQPISPCYNGRAMYIVRDTLKGSVFTLAEGGCRDCDRDYSAFE